MNKGRIMKGLTFNQTISITVLILIIIALAGVVWIYLFNNPFEANPYIDCFQQGFCKSNSEFNCSREFLENDSGYPVYVEASEMKFVSCFKYEIPPQYTTYVHHYLKSAWIPNDWPNNKIMEFDL